MSDLENIIDKRLFYLMLSIGQGQSFARDMGFQDPSVDVEQAELFDIASRWALFVNQGILNNIEESATWALDLLEKSDKLVNPKEDLIPFFVSYGVALLNKMLENGNISIVINEAALNDWQEMDTNDE